MMSLRNKIWNDDRVRLWFYLRYLKRTYIGLLRGRWSKLLGRVNNQNTKRPLILGSNIDYDMGAYSEIVLDNYSDNEISHDAANIFFPTASSIGVLPHWDHMNLPISHPTRLRIKNSAKLILEPNTVILAGCYLAIWHNQHLRIGANSYIAHNVCINTRCGLDIGANVMIAHDTTIMDYDGHPIFSIHDDQMNNNDYYGGSFSPIRIEDNVWIGFGSTILKGVTIGAGSIIGANSCVTSDIPPNCIAAGNPAKVIKENIKWRR